MMRFPAGRVDQGIVKKLVEAWKMFTRMPLLSPAWSKEIESVVSLVTSTPDNEFSGYLEATLEKALKKSSS